jgi:hypothetical protein
MEGEGMMFCSVRFHFDFIWERIGDTGRGEIDRL